MITSVMLEKQFNSFFGPALYLLTLCYFDENKLVYVICRAGLL